ncbi:peptidoglycan DD-metalloendopeptidase family protein [Glutamicibacter sp.]|uniref:M23 family metallopeptidase n=1 Tax=Glutamicibacter sp. TaxID=1931995 RepID=UPI003D6C0BF2
MSSALAWPGAAGALPARAESSTLAFPAASALDFGRDAVTVPEKAGASAVQVLGLSSLGEKHGGSEPGPLASVAANRAAMTANTSAEAPALPAPLALDQGIRPAMLSPGLLLEHPVATRRISSPYGWRANPTGFGRQIHIGQDYPISCGSPVQASESGRVVVASWAGHSGQRVTIDHGHNVQTGYSHNSLLLVSVGEYVVQGQMIALAGTTGNSTGCHVHFEVIINGRWHDPRNYLPLAGGQRRALFASTQFAEDAGSAMRNQSATGTSGQYAGTARRHGSTSTEHPTQPKSSTRYHADPVQPPAASKKKETGAAKPKTQPKKEYGKVGPSPRPAQPAPEPSKTPKPPQKLNTESPKTTPSPSTSPTPVSAEPSAPSAVPTPSDEPAERPSEPTAAPTQETELVGEPSPSTAPTTSPLPSTPPSSVKPPAPDSSEEETGSTDATPTSEPTQAPQPSADSGVEPQKEQEPGGSDSPASEDATDPTARVERTTGVAQPKTVDLQANEPEKKAPVAKALPPAKFTAPRKQTAKEPPAEKPKVEVAVPTAKKQAKAPAQPKAAAPAKPKVAAPVKPKAAAPTKPKVAAPAKPKVAAPVKPKAAAPAKPKASAPVKQVAKAPVATMPKPKPKPKPAIAAPAVQKVAHAPARPKPKATAPAQAEAAAPAKLPQAPAAAAPPASEAKP